MATSNAYQRALDQLAPLEPMLAGFARRNKNQHRRARWWASFGMLRRDVNKLLVELVGAAGSKAARALSATTSSAPSPATSVSSAAPKAKKTAATAAAAAAAAAAAPKARKYEDQHLLATADRRAAWIRDVLVPKCYIQFGQLTADNQFATLGVVLLGVLAQVDGACCALVGQRRLSVDQQHQHQQEREQPEIAEKRGTTTEMVAAATAAAAATEGRKVSRPGSAPVDGVPLAGRAITREEAGGVISREAAAAAAATASIQAGSSGGRAKIPTLAKAAPSPSKGGTGTTAGLEDVSDLEKRRVEVAQKMLKRKRDSAAVDTRSPASAVHHEEDEKEPQDSKSDGGPVEQVQIAGETTKRSKVSTSTAESPQPASKALIRSQGDVTTGTSTGSLPDRKMTKEKKIRPAEMDGEQPRKKNSKKSSGKDDDDEGEDAGRKEKKKKKKKGGGGRDEFDSLFSSLF
ncbi:uncharacterized protein B0I36DRAFT_358321 [Microdochium trichocladiopsis]|uniref:RNase MRP protein 1 RNA binding domain-containing protein n=1 Tax=Microdochium trichocladiopsis TaxID=1682393 RepID=A0A9P8YJF9_9PEZI|nr:uncharacterized protein B0I36DRAFT_358321 [Microdochium trichocladiopsis]KAH7041123.1 hypothetical protein B0I36DRAFT_358321 [Microdochium trichocladiopsis]